MPRLTENVLLTFVCQIPNAQAKKGRKCNAKQTSLFSFAEIFSLKKNKSWNDAEEDERTRKTNTLNPKIASFWQLKKTQERERERDDDGRFKK